MTWSKWMLATKLTSVTDRRLEVSVRDELIKELTNTSCCGAMTDHVAAESMINDYAHELAEKIRAEIGLWRASDSELSAEEAADLIDPKVDK